MVWIFCSTFIWLLFCFGIFYFSDNKEYKKIIKFILFIILIRDLFVTIAYFTM